MATTDTRGYFVWHELLTTDQQAAIDFYTDVLGWKTQPFGPPKDGVTYQMWVSSQGPLGGSMALPKDVQRSGAQPMWIAHVAVGDVDASAALARKLGGKILREPETIPDVGRFAIFQDPQGATLSMYTSAHPMPPHDSGKHGEFCWSELVTTDHQAALSFYSQLFGWEKVRSHDMGPMGEYLLFGAHGKDLGGMFTKAEGQPMPTAWGYYVEVSDLDAAVARATARGGRLLNGPMEVPGGARIAQLMDPQGAAFALHSQKQG